MKPPINLYKPTITVNHSKLTRFSDSEYKSNCPVCDNGILLVQRDQKTFELLEFDMCISCGQHVRYRDINIMRQQEKIQKGR